MDSYEINKNTVALIPKENKTIVYEVDNSFVVNKSPLKIVEESCEYFGSSLEGRQTGTSALVGFTHKVPVIIEESFDLIFFPTLSPKNRECSWLAYSHIFKPDKFKDKNIVKMRIKNNQMIINSYASEIGKVEEKLEIETSNDANIDISFSAKYMLEALKTMKDDEILILLNGEVKPIVIKSMKDESLIQLILPIKTY